MIIARRCHVAGRVQGVYFRASTREQAQQRGLAGHAQNLADGRVEVLVIGESAAVHALIDWLHRGPPSADVTRVDVEEVAVEASGMSTTGFTTG